MLIHILGGGSGQLSLINRCRELGFKVSVSDKNPEAPGCLLADYFIEASTFDAERTADALSAFMSETGEHIDGIIAAATDQPVLTAAIVSESLGIAYHLNRRQAELVTDKIEQKNFLNSRGIPLLPYRVIEKGFSPGDLDGMMFPVVCKPADSQGQRGVVVADSPEEVSDFYQEVESHSRRQGILVEEYYDSEEVTLSGWVENGKLHVLSLTDRVTTQNLPHIGVCIAHHYPSKHMDKLQEIRNIASRVIEFTGIKSGPAYMQFLCGGRGVFLNEAAARLGGAYEDRFIPFICGTDLLDLSISLATGQPAGKSIINKPDFNKIDRVVSLQMFYCCEGVIKSCSGMNEVLSLDDVTAGGFLQSEGTAIRPMQDSTQRAGYFLVCTGTMKKADAAVSAAYKNLEIRDLHGKNMIIFDNKMLFGGYSG